MASGSAGGTGSPADVDGRWASRGEDGVLALALRVGHRDDRDHGFRVRMLRVGDDLLGLPDLDDAARYMTAMRSLMTQASESRG